ncbi:MAG: RNA polymerase sigma-70 factor [Bacteroidota bacterium]
MTTAATDISLNIQAENDYELIFRQYYRGLCNYANVLLRDMDNAEETVQNVFVKLWEKRDEMAIDSSVKSYLYKAVYNAALNEIKHQKVKQNYSQMEARNEPVVEPILNSNLKELEKNIEKALHQLPEQCRLIFRMSRFEELKYREIANVLNISIKTVENQMGKALRLMRENLSDYLTILFIIFNFLNK